MKNLIYILVTILALGATAAMAMLTQKLYPEVYPQQDGNFTPLMIAVFTGTDFQSYLVPAEVNKGSLWGRTALMYAAMKGNVKAVQALLKTGANVNARDVDGLTALDFTARAAGAYVREEKFGKQYELNLSEPQARRLQIKLWYWRHIWRLLRKHGAKTSDELSGKQHRAKLTQQYEQQYYNQPDEPLLEGIQLD